MSSNDELFKAVDDALAEGPRFSPAARRFLAGEMKREEAIALGFIGEDE